jgi:hypothetical protein
MSYPIYINTYRLLGILILIDLSNHGNLNRNPNYVFFSYHNSCSGVDAKKKLLF